MLKVNLALEVEKSSCRFAETYARLLFLKDFVLAWAQAQSCVFAESLGSSE